MKLNPPRSLIKWFLATSLALYTQSAFALKDDTRRPIDVLSEKQTLDIDTSRAIFSENVFITQGSIQIKAQKVIINRPQNKKQNDTLDAFGSPVYFQQTLDNGKVVYGEGDKVHYDINSEFIVLTGNAKLRQAESQIEGREITYDVKEQQFKANGSSKKRVRTTLLPSQLETNKTVIEKKPSNHFQFNTNAPLQSPQGLKQLQKQHLDSQHKK